MNEKKFEDALQELEKIVNEMESEGLGLDDSIKKYETGIKLASFCRDKLDKAEKKIEILTRKPDGTVDLKDFSDNTDNNNQIESSVAAVEPQGKDNIETNEDIESSYTEESSEIEPELNENEKNNETSKLSDITHINEETDEKFDIDDNSLKENNYSDIPESYNEEDDECSEEFSDDNNEDEIKNEIDVEKVEDNKPKIIRETKPQEHEDSFEDLLF